MYSWLCLPAKEVSLLFDKVFEDLSKRGDFFVVDVQGNNIARSSFNMLKGVHASLKHLHDALIHNQTKHWNVVSHILPGITTDLEDLHKSTMTQAVLAEFCFNQGIGLYKKLETYLPEEDVDCPADDEMDQWRKVRKSNVENCRATAFWIFEKYTLLKTT
jgi:hypothetical protein